MTRLPDPALVVLIGAAGSGKSTWAQARYRSQEIVSSDELRGIVGSGEHDLDASDDAFGLLDQIVDARLQRGLTTVVDTLGLDSVRRSRWRDVALAAGLPTVAVVMVTPDAECRRRNNDRDRPVPATALTNQLGRARGIKTELANEGWDQVVEVAPGPTAEPNNAPPRPSPKEDRRTSHGLEIVLQLSRFPWGEVPASWLREVAIAADEAGFAGISLMDHLIQIPQVGRAWDPIPEPWVTLGLLAGLDTGLKLGTLVTPVTFRKPGITGKAAATLDALSNGRAFVGVGAGWWKREHLAFGLAFPDKRERLDQLEIAIETMRALWAKGTKAHRGVKVELPETTNYPRPTHDIPIIVGGSGEQRTLKIAARLADACNLPSDLETLDHKIEVLHRHCDAVKRDRGDVAITVLDLPIIGTDRDDTWARVERLRGPTKAATFAKRHHAGEVSDHRDRYARLAARGVSTVFLGVPDLNGPDDIRRLSTLND